MILLPVVPILIHFLFWGKFYSIKRPVGQIFRLFPGLGYQLLTVRSHTMVNIYWSHFILYIKHLTWHVTQEMSLWHVTCDTQWVVNIVTKQFGINDIMWHVKCVIWHMTHDTWYVTRDTQGVLRNLSKFQLPSSYDLGDTVFWRNFHKGWFRDGFN